MNRRLAVAAAAVLGLGGAEGIATAAFASQPGGASVYVCVNDSDSSHSYYQFRAPVPHSCPAGWSLWQLAAARSGATPPPAVATLNAAFHLQGVAA